MPKTTTDQPLTDWPDDFDDIEGLAVSVEPAQTSTPQTSANPPANPDHSTDQPAHSRKQSTADNAASGNNRGEGRQRDAQVPAGAGPRLPTADELAILAVLGDPAHGGLTTAQRADLAGVSVAAWRKAMRDPWLMGEAMEGWRAQIGESMPAVIQAAIDAAMQRDGFRDRKMLMDRAMGSPTAHHEHHITHDFSGRLVAALTMKEQALRETPRRGGAGPVIDAEPVE